MQKIASVVLAALLFLTPTRFLYAQVPEQESAEVGLGFGSLLPARNGLKETVPGWAIRGGLPTSLGFFEAQYYNGIGYGIIYRSVTIDYRADIYVDPILAHFLLGFHIDQYEQATPEIPRKFAGGWHYGGGITQLIAGPVSARFDFRHRFGPGHVVEVLLGLTYRI